MLVVELVRNFPVLVVGREYSLSCSQEPSNELRPQTIQYSADLSTYILETHFFSSHLCLRLPSGISRFSFLLICSLQLIRAGLLFCYKVHYTAFLQHRITSCSNTLNIHSSLMMRDQVSQPHKEAGKNYTFIYSDLYVFI